MIKVKINGKEIEVQPKTTIIEAADKLGIDIPRFCYHKKLSVAANCRMCLVEVKKFGKPLPACATQLMDGMEISTNSKSVKDTQKSIMEFLLINHPLDCPICDQGGECDLQDTAVAYGASKTRYTEEKRVVFNKNIGPFISTDLTRCIQCTRCVRFLKEVGGVMELGLVGRGEHAEISAYVDKAVGSELSGNIIDLCPVGALTSKPFRYSARTWELIRRPSISIHDSLGSNLEFHIKDHKVMRALPKENEAINECWISDRDRYSYEGLNHKDRLQTPMIKVNKSWKAVDWDEAFEFIVKKIKPQIDKNQGDTIGFLYSPQSSIEEAFLVNKIADALGSCHVDYRVRQDNFDLKGVWLGCPVEDIEKLKTIVLIGSNIRSEQPLMANRFRKMAHAEGKIFTINSYEDDLLMPVTDRIICRPSDYSYELLKILKALTTLRKLSINNHYVESQMKAIPVDGKSLAYAKALIKAKNMGSIFIGQNALNHKSANDIYVVAKIIGESLNINVGSILDAPNIVGLDMLSHNLNKSNTMNMLESKLSALITVNLEGAKDISCGKVLTEALKKSKFNLAITPYSSDAYAEFDCLLPMATFTESSGTYINIARQDQSIKAVTKPLGKARPAWKILRVLANYLQIDGFTYESSEDIKKEILGNNTSFNFPEESTNEKIKQIKPGGQGSLDHLHLVRSQDNDMIVRRADALHALDGNWLDVARVNPKTAVKFKLKDSIKVDREGEEISLPIVEDEKIATNTVCYYQKLTSLTGTKLESNKAGS